MISIQKWILWKDPFLFCGFKDWLLSPLAMPFWNTKDSHPWIRSCQYKRGTGQSGMWKNFRIHTVGWLLGCSQDCSATSVTTTEQAAVVSAWHAALWGRGRRGALTAGSLPLCPSSLLSALLHSLSFLSPWLPLFQLSAGPSFSVLVPSSCCNENLHSRTLHTAGSVSVGQIPWIGFAGTVWYLFKWVKKNHGDTLRNTVLSFPSLLKEHRFIYYSKVY